jgi:hypothetical protein
LCLSANSTYWADAADGSPLGGPSRENVILRNEMPSEAPQRVYHSELKPAAYRDSFLDFQFAGQKEK